MIRPASIFPRLLLLLLLWTVVTVLPAQGLLNQELAFECRGCSPAKALVDLSRQTGINIVFSDRFFARCPDIDLPSARWRLSAVLDTICGCAKISYKEVDGQIVLFRRNLRFSLSGFVVDKETGDRLIGANIRADAGKGLGAISNEFGFFSLTLEEGQYDLVVTALGYRSIVVPVTLDRDRKLTITMGGNLELPEIVISDLAVTTEAGVNNSDYRQRLPLADLGAVPMPGGEADLLRLAALQPGVQTGVDGLGGLHIRGGNADQNLILLDDVPVYNPNHALGLFSIFNPETVSNARLWKGDFPARYGGRVASVLDIRTREGNFRENHAHVSTGLFASSLTVEGPVVRDKSSFLFGGRFTYFKPWVRFFSQRDNLLTFSGDRVAYRFHDLNLKWNYTFTERHRLYLTWYSGGDVFQDQFDQRYVSTQGLLTDRYALGSSWGNSIAALRWNQLLGNRLFSNTTLRYSRFFYQSQLSFNSSFLYPNGKESVLADYGQLYQTLIRDWSGKTDFTFFPSDKLTFRWGVSYTLHDFQPGALSVNFQLPGQSSATIDSLASILLNNEKLGADEMEAYLDAEWRLNEHWSLNAGLNASVFQIRNVNFPNMLPRLRVARQGRKGWGIWGSYSAMAQNLHQIGSFNISLPFELWVPSTAKVPPERVWQTALGIDLRRAGWHWQLEGYYKQMDRVLTFLSANDALYTGGAEDASGWEDRIASGTGFSRGVEALVEWRKPKRSYFLSYTLSQSMRNFPDLNSGRSFYFRFDRRHDLKLGLHQRVLPWLDADLAWYFATGNPITLAGVRFTHHSPNSTGEREVFVYTSVNGYRLPAYHRLDLTLKADLGGRRFRHSLQFGAYNVYNRNNPFFLFLDAGSGVAGKAIQYTLLPALPVLRYELKL